MTEIETAKKRLAKMLAVNLACVAVAVAALVGFFGFHLDAMLWVFGAALAAGFVTQIWFIAGFRRAKEGV